MASSQEVTRQQTTLNQLVNSKEDKKADKILRKWKKIFEVTATNGEMDFKAFQIFCQTISLGLDPKQMRKVFDKADIDKGGTIGFAEFVELNFQTLDKGSKKAKRIAARFNSLTCEFHTLDDDESGELDLEEFSKFCKNAGLELREEQIETFFHAIDTDSNGYISFHEFFSELVDPQIDIFDLYQQELEMDDEDDEADDLPDTLGGSMEEPSLSSSIIVKDERADNTLRKWKSVFDTAAEEGEMDIDCFRSFVRNIGMNLTEEELQEMFELADSNGDGVIDFIEFVNQKLAALDPETARFQRISARLDSLKREFNRLDADEDGSVVFVEFQQFCKDNDLTKSYKEQEMLFKAIDKNHNGFITFYEFLVELIEPNGSFSMLEDEEELCWKCEMCFTEVIGEEICPMCGHEKGGLFQSVLSNEVTLSNEVQLEEGLERIESYRKDFNEMDKTGDGKLGQQEFVLFCLNNNELNKSEAETLFKIIDQDGSGLVSYEEFAEHMKTVLEVGMN